MTVLVDTTIWADHFRHGDSALVELLEADLAVLHPFVLGELALGNLRNRERTVAAMMALPAAEVTAATDFLAAVVGEGLAASGLGFVDAHLVTAARAAGLSIWTRDRRLANVADGLGLAWNG